MRSFRLVLAVPAVLLLAAPAAAEYPSEADALVRQGREEGLRFRQFQDKAAKDAARGALERAEKMLRDAAKKDASCQKCVESLAAAQFFKTHFGLEKNYKDCVQTAADGLVRFPASASLAFYKGYAHHGAGEYAEAARALSRYLAASRGEPERENQAREVLADSRKRFLDGWYDQKDFYTSDESRITRFNPQTKKNDVLLQITPQYELSLGANAFNEITQKTKPVNDAETQSYLQQLVNRMVEKTPGPGFAYKVTVVDSPEINAVTPPGHIIVNTGLLAFAENEAELAGVLAHELAHNYGHHSGRTMIKSYQAQMVAAALAEAIKPKGQVAQLLTKLGTGLGVNLFLRAYSRGEEKQADLYGSHILFNAGYSPTAMSSFFLRLYKLNPKNPIKFLSTHPPLADRADYLTDYIEAFPLDRESKADTEEFRKIRARLAPATPDRARTPTPAFN